jgi:hypothetical protein
MTARNDASLYGENDDDEDSDVEDIKYDEKISKIFYYFAKHTNIASGRTVGRKIGVVQEILLLQYFRRHAELVNGLHLERRLSGRSGAEHKVEFSWFDHVVEIPEIGESVPHIEGLIFEKTMPSGRYRVAWEGGKITIAPGKSASSSGPLLARYLKERDRDFRFVETEGGLRLVVFNTSRLLASLESKRVGAQRFSDSDQLGSGIQTIEKAKQASLVAIDLDIQHNGNLRCLAGNAPRKCINGVVVGNGVHWTAKDRNVLRTYTDFVYLARDEAIIRYAEFVRVRAERAKIDFRPFFMSYFNGLTKFAGDDFPVGDDDFAVVTPEANAKPLSSLLLDHLRDNAGKSF